VDDEGNVERYFHMLAVIMVILVEKKKNSSHKERKEKNNRQMIDTYIRIHTVCIRI
jgi:hypothetical protein